MMGIEISISSLPRRRVLLEVLVERQGGVAGVVEDWCAVDQHRERDGDEAGVLGADVLVDAGVSCGVVVGCGLLPGHAVLGGYDADDPHLVVVDWLVVSELPSV
jgi:hypothetical protein